LTLSDGAEKFSAKGELRMRIALISALSLMLVQGGCARRPVEPPPPPPPPDVACNPPYYRFAFLATSTTIYRPGTSVGITPTVDMSPAGTQALPLRCTSGWKVTGPARLSTDGTRLEIAPDAPPGDVVSVSFRHAGRTAETRLTVIGRDEVVLTGTWSQRSTEGCEATDPVRELVFQPGNRFAVTFVPFETYQDYWGTYEFDPASGRLLLKVEGGNNVPARLDLEGKAGLESGRLTLREIFLGSKSGFVPVGGCTYVF
jgi:hypothetical protein